jgi:hypothetical protein
MPAGSGEVRCADLRAEKETGIAPQEQELDEYDEKVIDMVLARLGLAE